MLDPAHLNIAKIFSTFCDFSLHTLLQTVFSSLICSLSNHVPTRREQLYVWSQSHPRMMQVPSSNSMGRVTYKIALHARNWQLVTGDKPVLAQTTKLQHCQGVGPKEGIRE